MILFEICIVEASSFKIKENAIVGKELNFKKWFN